LDGCSRKVFGRLEGPWIKGLGEDEIFREDFAEGRTVVT
jgi:hypothetical protein